MKKVARNLIIRAVNDKYICALKHPRTLYAAVEPITILEHLWKNYGTVETDDLEQNEKNMKKPWNPPDTIETLFEQLTTGQKFAIQGGESCDDTLIIRWGYENIHNTGLFDTPCEKWREKPTSEKLGKISKHISPRQTHIATKPPTQVMQATQQTQ